MQLRRHFTGKGRIDRHALAIGGIALATVLGVGASLTPSSTYAALTAKITNSADKAGTRTYFTCANAMSSSASPRPYLSWAASTAANTTSSWGGATTQTDLSGNGRTGRYSSSALTWSISVDGSSYGCLRDTPTASATFTGSGDGYCLYQYGNVSGNNQPQTFSVEAWFNTTTKGTAQGKIIGFGDSQTTAGDGSYDRHIYLDKDGRVVFGVYPGSVKIVYTAAGTNYADGHWHHVVGTLGSAGMSLYVDGRLAGSNAAVTSAQTYNGYWKVGCGNLSAWQNAATAAAGNTSNYDFNGASYFTGQIQFAAVYSVALSATEVKEHYLAGAD